MKNKNTENTNNSNQPSLVYTPELQIFNKKVNNNVKIIPFKSMDRSIGQPRYFPPSTRE